MEIFLNRVDLDIIFLQRFILRQSTDRPSHKMGLIQICPGEIEGEGLRIEMAIFCLIVGHLAECKRTSLISFFRTVKVASSNYEDVLKYSTNIA